MVRRSELVKSWSSWIRVRLSLYHRSAKYLPPKLAEIFRLRFSWSLSIRARLLLTYICFAIDLKKSMCLET